jgi:hypothetical protein
MKRILLATILLLGFCGYGAAQQNAADIPATKEDIDRYMQTAHSKEMASKMMDAMMKPLHQMIHEDYLKGKDKLPPDFEERMSKRLEEYFKGVPWDEILNSTVPVYQKHFTKGDVDTMVAFYSTPTGQKLIREMPEIMAESMQNMMPLLRKHTEAINERLRQDISAMMKESDGKNGKTAPLTNN